MLQNSSSRHEQLNQLKKAVIPQPKISFLVALSCSKFALQNPTIKCPGHGMFTFTACANLTSIPQILEDVTQHNDSQTINKSDSLHCFLVNSLHKARQALCKEINNLQDGEIFSIITN